MSSSESRGGTCHPLPMLAILRLSFMSGALALGAPRLWRPPDPPMAFRAVAVWRERRRIIMPKRWIDCVMVWVVGAVCAVGLCV